MTKSVPNIPATIAEVRGDPRMADALGAREGGEPEDELQHFYLCQACGQPVDMRDLAAVFHHEDEAHEPLPSEDADRLRRISHALVQALERGARPAG